MREETERLKEYIGAGYTLIQVVTWEEDRAMTMIREVGKALKMPLTTWSVSAGFGGQLPPAAEDPMDALARLGATTDPRLFVLSDFHASLQAPAVVRRLRELCKLMETRKQALVMIGPFSAVPLELEKEVVIIDLPPPSPAELKTILAECVKSTGKKCRIADDQELQESVIRAAHGLTEKEFRRMMRRLLIAHPDIDETQVKDVLEEKRQVVRRSDLLEFYEVTQSLADVGGLDLLKKWLMNRAEAFGEKARKYGLPEPKGLLLLGVQGCGKSLSARAVSGLWGIPLIRLDLSAILDREGEGDHLRRSLRLAEELSPCVLWIDEIEKGFSQHRVSGKEEHGRMARAFATFLVWLQEKKKPVYVIATSNSIAEMPPELVRKGRFDDVFFVDLPREAERAEIFRIHLVKRDRDPAKFDLAGFARSSEGFSGSEIEQVIISAMYESFTAGREVESKDVLRAISETVALSETMEESIKALRDWAKNRARSASLDTKLIDLLNNPRK